MNPGGQYFSGSTAGVQGPEPWGKYLGGDTVTGSLEYCLWIWSSRVVALAGATTISDTFYPVLSVSGERDTAIFKPLFGSLTSHRWCIRFL